MESEHRARDSRQASPERAPCAEPAKRNLSSELSAPSGSHQMRRLSRSNSSTGSRLIRWSRGSRNGSAKFGYTAAEHSKASNKNLVSAFTWTADLLASIASNTAAKVTNHSTGRQGCILFAVFGACPNSMCGMQAVIYVIMDGEKQPPIDFWWIKPRTGQRDVLEEATLNRNVKGTHKNDPGRSRPLYAQFSSLFERKAMPKAKIRFGLMPIGDVTRAYIEILETGDRLFIYMIWQESWSSMISRHKFIKGKLVYQKSPYSEEYFARPYTFREGSLEIPVSSSSEERLLAPFPNDTLKRMPPDDVPLD